ncbi:hypothetical protein BIY27_14875 [Gibbsiella quercinecans]|nr:hypothetical protein BIY27_14875 [Gibbsiella quercinecans]
MSSIWASLCAQQASLDPLSQALFKGLHARLRTGLQQAGELMRFTLADHTADRRRGGQDFKHCHPASAVLA